MLGLGAAVLDGVLLAGIREGMDPEEEWRDGFALFFGQSRFRRVVDEMGAVVGEHRVDGVGNGGNQSPQEVAGDTPSCSFVQLGIKRICWSCRWRRRDRVCLLRYVLQRYRYGSSRWDTS